ncbi:MAG: hypothetical protein A2V70_03165 [Planctomycetes bacterium RBG_13_63_9]|nr:MAG: hypothetical protein A2V70_03165 [Planctomycetes bacterium RBG_13_63_9]
MPRSRERPTLHVEGPDDKHALEHLLIRHGVEFCAKPRASELPDFNETGGLEQILGVMQTAVETGSDRATGFVLDADSPLADRWSAVRGRLAGAGVETPATPPADGFVGYSPRYRATVGVWLMPDNQHDGTLETFLRALVAGSDPLIDHAEQSTKLAREKGAAFSEPDTRKAILHAWLAWQKEPGRPYGTAIRAKYFGHDSTAAKAFVNWFKRLFELR